MKTIGKVLSVTRIKRIREQGYFNKSDQEIIDLAFGNRFAYRLCTTLLALGVILANIPILCAVLCIAFMSVMLPHHPFDYIYNHALSKRLQLPKLPPRSPQLDFACSIATIWTGTTIYLFHSGYDLAGYIVGGAFLIIATMLSTIDLCLPSIIYNSIFRKRIKLSEKI